MSDIPDFAALHRERVARLESRKRERSISPPSPRKASKLQESTTTLPSGARLTSFTTTIEAQQNARKSTIANAANEKLKAASTAPPAISSITEASRQGDIVYPFGTVKKTWAFGHERHNDIKLEEVLEPLSVRTAVLSAYQWNTDWVLSKLKVPATKCVFVMQGKEESLRKTILEDTASARSWLRICFPPMDGQTHCMHSKLMLLFHSNKLRIAVPTANLLNFDWGETGVMENSVFLIDLPRLPTPQTRQTLTAFGGELMFFLDKQGLDQDIKDGVLNFDFSATAKIAFVSSIGGISVGDDAYRSGLMSLSKGVRQLNLINDDVQIDFAASSIGSLKDDQLKLLHAAACGRDVFQLEADAGKAKAATFFNRTARDDHSIRDKIRIYFPTKETVQASTAGAAGTICLARQYFEDIRFPKRCFRDYTSTRPGLLSHNKLMYVRPGDGVGHSWLYIGSSNMSESAWGKAVHKKKEKQWHINCRNWECGVLLPVAASSHLEDVVVKQEVSEVTNTNTADEDGSETESEVEDDKPRRSGEEASSETASETEELAILKAQSADVIAPSQTLPTSTTAPAQTTPLDLSSFEGIFRPPFVVPGAQYNEREPWFFKEQY